MLPALWPALHSSMVLPSLPGVPSTCFPLRQGSPVLMKTDHAGNIARVQNRTLASPVLVPSAQQRQHDFPAHTSKHSSLWVRRPVQTNIGHPANCVSNCSRIGLEVNNRTISGEYLHVWKLNNIILNPYVKEDVRIKLENF